MLLENKTYDLRIKSSEELIDLLTQKEKNSRWDFLQSDNIEFVFQNNVFGVMINNDFTPIREDIAFRSICNRAKVYGDSLKNLKKDFLCQVLNKCLDTRGNILVKQLTMDGQINAIHSADYAIVSQTRIYNMFLEHFQGAERFHSAVWCYEYTSADFEIINQQLQQGYSSLLNKHNLPCNNVKVLVKILTSDVATSGINIYTALKTDNLYIPLTSSPICIKHIGDPADRIEDYKKALSEILSICNTQKEELEKLESIKIYNPINCLKGCLKVAKIPNKAADSVIEMFDAVNGEEECSALDVYCGISYVFEVLTANEVRECEQIRYAESIAKLIKQKRVFTNNDVKNAY